MPMRYSGITNILAAGNTIAHGLGGTPDEYFFTPTIALGSSFPYFQGVSSTNLVVAAAVGGATGLVAAAISSTWVK